LVLLFLGERVDGSLFSRALRFFFSLGEVGFEDSLHELLPLLYVLLFGHRFSMVSEVSGSVLFAFLLLGANPTDLVVGLVGLV
jgi:hypothetical protein